MPNVPLFNSKYACTYGWNVLNNACAQTTEKGGGKQGILPQDPQTCFEKRGPTGLLNFFVFLPSGLHLHAISFSFAFHCMHCLDSMIEPWVE